MQHNHIVKYMFISLSLSELKMISFHKKKKKKEAQYTRLSHKQKSQSTASNEL